MPSECVCQGVRGADSNRITNLACVFGRRKLVHNFTEMSIQRSGCGGRTIHLRKQGGCRTNPVYAPSSPISSMTSTQVTQYFYQVSLSPSHSLFQNWLPFLLLLFKTLFRILRRNVLPPMSSIAFVRINYQLSSQV